MDVLEIKQRIKRDLAAEPEKRDQLLSLWDNPSELINVISQECSSLPKHVNNRPHTLNKEHTLPRGASFYGLPAFYCYNNYVIQDRNTCGQAVIGSFVDFYQKNPFNLPRTAPGYDNRMHYENMPFIGGIFRNFGPNYPLPNGVTVRETIMAACKHYSLQYQEWYPQAYSNGADAKAQLQHWIATYQKPVAVLVDTGTSIFNNPQHYTLHWCIVHAFDANMVHVATWEKSYPISWDKFMEAWHCWWLPYPNNYYQLRVWDI